MEYYAYYNWLLNIFGGALVIILLLLFTILIVGIVANWKLFKKAGKNGWECIIPFYGYYVLVEIAGLNWWWFLLLICDSIVEILDIEILSSLANLVSLFASFNCYYNIARKFNKNTGTSVLAGIFSFIFILIFGFSKKEVYDLSIPVCSNGIFGNSNNNYQSNTREQSTTFVDRLDGDSNKNVKKHSFCNNCGFKLDNNIKFCPNCGKEII